RRLVRAIPWQYVRSRGQRSHETIALWTAINFFSLSPEPFLPVPPILPIQPFLPNATRVRAHHRRIRLARERFREFGKVRDGAVRAEAPWGVWFGLHARPRCLRSRILAPNLSDPDEQPLLRREAIDGFVGLRGGHRHVSGKGQTETAVVGGVF